MMLELEKLANYNMTAPRDKMVENKQKDSNFVK